MRFIDSNVKLVSEIGLISQVCKSNGVYGKSLVVAWPSVHPGSTSSLCVAVLDESDTFDGAMSELGRRVRMHHPRQSKAESTGR